MMMLSANCYIVLTWLLQMLTTLKELDSVHNTLITFAE
jgi:hypothetical protein